MTGPRLALTRASDIEPASRGIRRPEWGPWDIDRDVLVLWTTAGGYRYEVDLERCATSAQVLDYLCQVVGKRWGATLRERNTIIAGLVTALDDVLTPQAHLCSGGQGKRLARSAIRRLAGRGVQ